MIAWSAVRAAPSASYWFGADELGRITGQKPVVRRAKKSIAAFKVRKGQPIATSVTLRGERMYEFLDRLVSIALPRVRDFRGVSNRAFDGRGSYSLGVKEQIIFPEIEYDKIDAIRGMDIAINTSAKNDDEARALLAAFRFPFRVDQVKPQDANKPGQAPQVQTPQVQTPPAPNMQEQKG